MARRAPHSHAPGEMGGLCPTCGGEVLVIWRRAWCMKRFVDGGCANHWIYRRGRWLLQPLCPVDAAMMEFQLAHPEDAVRRVGRDAA